MVCDCKLLEIEERRQRFLIERCQLPPGTEDLDFESFFVYREVEKAVAYAKMVARRELTWLTLIGDVDRGKTHLGIAICRQWLDNNQAACYAYVPLLLDELRDGYSRQDTESYETRFHFFCEVPLLVLDDLGVESQTPWVNEKLDTIVDFRYIRGLPLVILTNLGINELSVRIRSRIQRVLNSKVVPMLGPEFQTLRGKL